MSERIQELYMRAIEYTDSVVPPERRYNDIYYSIASAKHAELIVKDCVVQIKNERKGFNPTEWDQGADYGLKHATDVIKEHFGVEE